MARGRVSCSSFSIGLSIFRNISNTALVGLFKSFVGPYDRAFIKRGVEMSRKLNITAFDRKFPAKYSDFQLPCQSPSVMVLNQPARLPVGSIRIGQHVVARACQRSCDWRPPTAQKPRRTRSVRFLHPVRGHFGSSSCCWNEFSKLRHPAEIFREPKHYVSHFTGKPGQ